MLLRSLASRAVLPALAVAAGAVAVPVYGEATDDVTVATAADHPRRVERPIPKRCRLLPASQQPSRIDRQALATARRQAGATGQVVTLYVPATTCNTPPQGSTGR